MLFVIPMTSLYGDLLNQGFTVLTKCCCTISVPGGCVDVEATLMSGSASAEVTPGGAAATSALSFRSSSVHSTAAMGFEFMCCLNLKP